MVLSFIIAATATEDYADADGGAFFGYIGVACALVFASTSSPLPPKFNPFFSKI